MRPRRLCSTARARSAEAFVVESGHYRDALPFGDGLVFGVVVEEAFWTLYERVRLSSRRRACLRGAPHRPGLEVRQGLDLSHPSSKLKRPSVRSGHD